jgi:hypothetical protein
MTFLSDRTAISGCGNSSNKTDFHAQSLEIHKQGAGRPSECPDVFCALSELNRAPLDWAAGSSLESLQVMKLMCLYESLSMVSTCPPLRIFHHSLGSRGRGAHLQTAKVPIPSDPNFVPRPSLSSVACDVPTVLNSRRFSRIAFWA